MTEIRFVVEEAPEGGFVARAVGADTIGDLHEQVRGAVQCHFDESAMPHLIQLHITREEVIAT